MTINLKEFNQAFARLEIPEFASKLPDPSYAWTFEKLAVMQVNVCYACNFACEHCFLEAAPGRLEVMSKQTMLDCLHVFAANDFDTLDITGGAPELHPDLAWFIALRAKPHQCRIAHQPRLFLFD